MLTYLIKVEIRDNNIQYREFALLEANDYGEAEKLATEQIKKDNDSVIGETWWTKPEDTASISLKGIESIDEEDAEFLQMHGIAYFIDR